MLGYTGVASYLGPGVRSCRGVAPCIYNAGERLGDCSRRLAFVGHRSPGRGVAIVGTSGSPPLTTELLLPAGVESDMCSCGCPRSSAIARLYTLERRRPGLERTGLLSSQKMREARESRNSTISHPHAANLRHQKGRLHRCR